MSFTVTCVSNSEHKPSLLDSDDEIYLVAKKSFKTNILSIIAPHQSDDKGLTLKMSASETHYRGVHQGLLETKKPFKKIIQYHKITKNFH